MPVVTWFRATLGFAYRTLKEGKLDFPINDSNKLINDENLKNMPQYVMMLATAYYIRGLAYEKKSDKVQASQDYQQAIKLLPNYALALCAFERVKRE